VVDPDNEVAEWPCDFTKVGESIILKDHAKASNNVKSCLLQVIRPQLHIINLTLAPPKPVVENKVKVIALINNSENETANSTVQFYVEKPLNVYHEKNDYAKYEIWSCSISQLENLPIRIHFKYIDIDFSYASPFLYMDTNFFSKDLPEDKISIKTYVDGEPVNLIVKSIDVANGQPIKVSEINFNSPCGACMVHNAKGICIKRRWEDVWTEWRTGKEIIVNTYASGSKTGIGGTTHRVIFNLLIDKCQVLLGNETITIDAGNESSYNTMYTLQLKLKEDFQENWKDYEKILVGENYTLIANVEDNVVRNETYLYGTDLAVTDLKVNDICFDGDEVNITAKIENLGLKNATEFWVNLTVNDVETKPRFIKGLNASEDVLVNWTLNVSRRRGQDNCTIEVKINTLDNAKYEENTNNDLMKKSVNVELSRDFFIQNLVFAMDNETLDPAHLPSGANN